MTAVLFSYVSASFPVLPLTNAAIASLCLLSIFVLFTGSGVMLPPMASAMSPSFGALGGCSSPRLTASFVGLLLLSGLPSAGGAFFVPDLFFAFSYGMSGPVASFVASLDSSGDLVPSCIVIVPSATASVDPYSLEGSISSLAALSLVSDVFSEILLPANSLGSVYLDVRCLLSVDSVAYKVDFYYVFGGSFVCCSLLFMESVGYPSCLF